MLQMESLNSKGNIMFVLQYFIYLHLQQYCDVLAYVYLSARFAPQSNYTMGQADSRTAIPNITIRWTHRRAQHTYSCTRTQFDDSLDAWQWSKYGTLFACILMAGAGARGGRSKHTHSTQHTAGPRDTGFALSSPLLLRLKLVMGYCFNMVPKPRHHPLTLPPPSRNNIIVINLV